MGGKKESIDDFMINTLERLGMLVNPIILSMMSEKGRILGFYFHSVYRDKSELEKHYIDPQNNLTVSQLNAFVEYFLKRGYIFITDKELAAGVDPEGSFIIMTFDDGYFNNMLVLDVLKCYDVKATFFVTTGNVESGNSFWWDVVYRYRFGKGASIDQIWKEQRYLKGFGHKYIEDYLHKEFGKNCLQPSSDIDRPLTRKELKEMACDPRVEIGNHTHNHAILTNCDADEMVYQLSTANSFLEETIGSSPRAVAFPNGNYNSEVLRITKELGFAYAYTTEGKQNALPLPKEGLTVISRFIAKSTNVEFYAGFNRIGYDVKGIYGGIKNRLGWS